MAHTPPSTLSKTRAGGPKKRHNTQKRKGSSSGSGSGPSGAGTGSAQKASHAHRPHDAAAATAPRSFILHSGPALSSSATQLMHDLRGLFEPYTASSLKQTKGNRLKDFVNVSGVLGVSHMLVLNQPGMSRKKNKTAAAPPPPPPASFGGGKGKGKDTPAAPPQIAVQPSAANDSGRVNLRICTLPRGPTLTFRINKYALRKDVLASQKRPQTKGNEYLTPPLLVLNNFAAACPLNADGTPGPMPRELQLQIRLFQHLFPPIHVATMHLSQARRIVLLHYSPETKTLDWRHYLIRVRSVGVSKRLRNVVEGSASKARQQRQRTQPQGADLETIAKNAASVSSGAGADQSHLPDLGKINDISDYVLGTRSRPASDGFTTDDDETSLGATSDGGEDSEAETTDDESDGEGQGRRKNRVDLFQDYMGKGNAGKVRSRAAAAAALAAAAGDDGEQGGGGAGGGGKGMTGNQRAVRLREIGPRMELRLIKIEEGIGGGEVLYHDYGASPPPMRTLLLAPLIFTDHAFSSFLSTTVRKSATEAAAQRRTMEAAAALRAERREAQERNVERKRAEAEARKSTAAGTRRGARDAPAVAAADDGAEGAGGALDSDEDDEDDEGGAGEDEFEYEDRFAGPEDERAANLKAALAVAGGAGGADDDEEEDDDAWDDEEELFEEGAEGQYGGGDDYDDDGEEDDGSDVEDESDGDLSPVEITSDFEEVFSDGEAVPVGKGNGEAKTKTNGAGAGRSAKKARR